MFFRQGYRKTLGILLFLAESPDFLGRVASGITRGYDGFHFIQRCQREMTSIGNGGKDRNGAIDLKPQRMQSLDLLRLFAVTRIIAFHVSAHPALGAIPALPLMFFAAGYLMAGSLQRSTARKILPRRLQRVLLPYWVYVATIVVVWIRAGVVSEMGVADWVGFILPPLSLTGLQGPGVGTDIEMTWLALWYIQVQLILVLLSPLLYRLFRRYPRAVLGGTAAAMLLSSVTVIELTGVFGVLLFWMLGFGYQDGTIRVLLERITPIVVLASAPFAVIAIARGVLPDGISNEVTTMTAIGGVAISVIAIMVSWPIIQWFERQHWSATFDGVLTWASSRLMTVYLWHFLVIYWIVSAIPWTGSQPIVLFTLTVLGTFGVCVALGWVEDIAARRPPRIFKRR